MKTLDVKVSSMNDVDPSDLIYSCWCGGDDILVVDGKEVIKMMKENERDNGNPASKMTLADAMKLIIEDSSGNSFDFVLIKNGKPHMLSIDWDE